MNKCTFDHASHAFGNTYAAQKVVAGAYDLYKNLDPTKLIKGTMKVRVLLFILTLSAFNFSCFLPSVFCAFQLAKAGMDHARREMARGSADSIGFFLALSAEVTIISDPVQYRMPSIMKNYRSLLFPTKVNSRNGSVQPVDARWEYAGEFN